MKCCCKDNNVEMKSKRVNTWSGNRNSERRSQIQRNIITRCWLEIDERNGKEEVSKKSNKSNNESNNERVKGNSLRKEKMR